jgi:protein-S-isoprenylcysteine O-methyltransferase Ste14
MWAISRVTQPVDGPAYVRLTIAALLLAIGCAFALGGVIAFKRARTTVNPLKPETTSAMVTDGVYRITRNPMYVGFLIMLIAWAVFLSSAWALLGPVMFVLYITRSQIVPEEKALLAIFGESFTSYQTRVRRWL